MFKGILPDSTVIAFKKLEGLQQGEKQFRRNTYRLEDGRIVFFPVWAAIKLDEVDIVHVLEELEGNANMEELSRACRIACWSIQDQESTRPTMGLAVQELEGLSIASMSPIPGLLQKLAMDDSQINGNTACFCMSLVSELNFSYSSSLNHLMVIE